MFIRDARKRQFTGCGRELVQEDRTVVINPSAVYVKFTVSCYARISREFEVARFYCLLSLGRKSIVFGSILRNGDFDGFSHFGVP